MVTALSGNHSRTFYVTSVSSFTHPTCYLFKYLPLSWRPFLNFSPLLSVKDLSSYFAEKIKVLNGELTQFRSVQSLSHVWLFATPWTTAHQASLSITNSQSLLKHMSIESVMPSNYLILCRLLLLCLHSFPTSGSFQISQLFASGQNTGVSASTSVLPMNTQDRFPLGWTGWISCSPRDSQGSSPTPQFKSINSSVFSPLYSPTLKMY